MSEFTILSVKRPSEVALDASRGDLTSDGNYIRATYVCVNHYGRSGSATETGPQSGATTRQAGIRKSVYRQCVE